MSTVRTATDVTFCLGFKAGLDIYMLAFEIKTKLGVWSTLHIPFEEYDFYFHGLWSYGFG